MKRLKDVKVYLNIFNILNYIEEDLHVKSR